MTVVVYSDGGCDPNPGLGGWGVVIAAPGGDVELMGAEPSSTNNRMELTAAIEALSWFPEGASIEMRCDSQYVVNSMTTWIAGWKRNGWKTAAKKPVLNDDLIKRLDALAQKRKVTWKWVKAHVGEIGNERADFLVNQAREDYRAGKSTPAAKAVATATPEASAYTVPVSGDLMKALLVESRRRGITVQEMVEHCVQVALPGSDARMSKANLDHKTLQAIDAGLELVNAGGNANGFSGSLHAKLVAATESLRSQSPAPWTIEPRLQRALDAVHAMAEARVEVDSNGLLSLVDKRRWDDLEQGLAPFENAERTMPKP